MNTKKPYIIETKNFIEVCYGGGYNTNFLKGKKGKIKKFSRQSQKNLLHKIELAINYTPTHIIKFYFNKKIPVNKSNLLLQSLFKSLERHFLETSKKMPLIFWRKCFKDNMLWFEVLIDFQNLSKIKQEEFLINMYWKMKVGKQGSIEFHQILNINMFDEIQTFCFENCDTDESNVGRFWGMFYLKYNKFNKVKRKNYSTLEIKEKIANLKPVRTNQIKRYLYKKN